MPEYRRFYAGNAAFFFTVVSSNRMPILTTEFARGILHTAWKTVEKRFPFTTDAICLLPDHIHCLWTLPEDDPNYSRRWSLIKKLFSQNYWNYVKSENEKHQVLPIRNESFIRRRELNIWQRRFWAHYIEDQDDLNRHLDYIHYNPVKHELVKNVCDWPWSSFHRYVKMGFYDINWGGGDYDALNNMGEYE